MYVMRRQPSQHSASRSRGVAALTVVMILFFVMALVAAYTNRNLVFEQRISANSYRSARALDASEGAIDWTLSMLNGGRINASCASSNTITDNDFRGNYLRLVDIGEPDNPGRYEVVWKLNPAQKMFPACISKDGVLSCICPTLTDRTPAIATPADGIGTAFNVSLRTPTNELQPGTLNIDALGCASIGTGAGACYNQAPLSQRQVVSDAKSGVRAGIGLVQALPVPPEATLTVGGGIVMNAGALTVTNEGTRRNGTQKIIVDNTTPANNWFRFRFGVDSATFKNQPAVVTIDCSAGCDSSNLADIHARFPRNPIWIEGNLTISSADQLGSMPHLPVPPNVPTPSTPGNVNDWNPIMLIVNGRLTVAADVRIVGFVHASDVSWASPGATLYGAIITPGIFTGTADAKLNYRADLLEFIGLYYGSFVRVPGSWKQLNTIS